MVACWDALGVLGALTAAWLMLRAVWSAGRAVYVFLLPSVRRGAPWLRAHGAWAVVTGATDGIGKAYAHELARRGLNIVLISRNLSKLEREAKEIERLHGTLTRIIQVDFTGGLEIYGAVEEGLKGLEIGVLVNNVGMSVSVVLQKTFEVENPAKRLSDIVNCNMLSVVQMTRIILPQMVSRRRGIIINVSSVAENHPHPLLAAYAATKAFVRSFSLAVATEYSSEGVTVQTVSPFVVSTKMSGHPKTGLLVKTPEDWASEAVDTLGLSSHTSGCLSHAVQEGALDAAALPPTSFLS
ncbi:very-long-chain 3-oxoacyl-CoA reductase-like [Trichechus manatus latirostris]|uniref:17beta-estradiol 17-dehydrogenase n=1 Tax=Trichechus manatus latirostris TaxID=127582 RepID=A0A2Y9DVF4_TRIMA|nr:very-long-chain 3-oxoacyl-CoA reductase-like [Trichechus manatus latirostris]